MKQEPVNEIIISQKKEEILNKLKKVSWKWNTIKYLRYETIHLYQNLWQQISRSKDDLPSGQNSVNKNVRFNISMLRSDLCRYGDAYIVLEKE